MWIPIGVTIGLIAPISLWAVEYRIERGLEIVLSPREWIPNPEWPSSGGRYLVGANFVDFLPRMQQYTKIAEIMITLASASIIFVPSHVAKQPALSISIILLGFSVVWGVLFIAWMSYCYEQALYDPMSFGPRQSSATFGLGFGALACFALAYLWLALVVAHAIAYGGPLS